jgi:hypothetical protein
MLEAREQSGRTSFEEGVCIFGEGISFGFGCNGSDMSWTSEFEVLGDRR